MMNITRCTECGEPIAYTTGRTKRICTDCEARLRDLEYPASEEDIKELVKQCWAVNGVIARDVERLRFKSPRDRGREEGWQ